MAFLDKIFRRQHVPAALLAAPGPTPWYALLQGPELSNRAGSLSWRSAGDSVPATGKVLLTASDGSARLALDFMCHVLPLTNSRILVWYVRELNRVGDRVVRSELVLRVLALDELAPIVDLGGALAQMGPMERMHYARSPVAESTIGTDLTAGLHKYTFPRAMAELSELHCFVHSTEQMPLAQSENYMRLALWELHPKDGTLEVTPQDWFNQGEFDFGYQWPTRVARDPKSGSIVGEGIRIGVFELDSTKRQVQRWLIKDPFWMPQRHG